MCDLLLWSPFRGSFPCITYQHSSPTLTERRWMRLFRADQTATFVFTLTRQNHTSTKSSTGSTWIPHVGKHPEGRPLAVGVLPVCVGIPDQCNNSIHHLSALHAMLTGGAHLSCYTFCTLEYWGLELCPGLFLCVFWWHLPVCSW